MTRLHAWLGLWLALGACGDTTVTISHTCKPCIDDSVCRRFDGTQVCNEFSGRCVECTPITEAADCATVHGGPQKR